MPDKNIEEWQPVSGYEGVYEVSNFGQVKSVSTKKPYRNGFRNAKPRILRPNIINGGYSQVALTRDKKRKHYLVHRLVAEAFVENPNGLPQVNHIDGNKQNNCSANLEWCTAKENMIHSSANGFRSDTRAVCQFTKDGKLVRTFYSIKEAARQTGIHYQNISSCLKGSYRSSGGFVWRYHNGG